MAQRTDYSKDIEVTQNDAQSEHSSMPLIGGTPKAQDESLGERAKRLWREMKEEDKRRREERVQHVSSIDATNITGHGNEGPKSNIKDGKGDKRLGAALLF